MVTRFNNIANEDVRALKDATKNLDTQKSRKDSNKYFLDTEFIEL